jgi:3-methyladenine DNA glycosylase AlkD
MLEQLKKELKKVSNPEKAKIYQRFFKTGKGEYGEGDILLGLTVPEMRKIAKNYDLSLKDIQELLNIQIHEFRFTALVILISKYNKAKQEDKEEIFKLYLKNYNNINNWDLVDISCPNIIGNYLLDKERDVLYEFAESDHLWKKRIAMISTFAFIRDNQFEDTLNIAEILLKDKHDLIHKAVGWMLREVGKRDQELEEKFLKKHYKTMPRTMLRYAIEKFSEEKRKFYMN